MKMFKLMKKLNDFFGFPVAIVGLLLAFFFFVYEKKPEVTYQILSESNVLDIREKIGKLNIFFGHEDIYKENKNLSLVTIRVVNSGKVNILSSHFDDEQLWGFVVENGNVIETQMLSSSSDYLKDKIIPRID